MTDIIWLEVNVLENNLDSKVKKIEKFLFYFLGAFAFTLPLSKAAGNIFLALSLIAFIFRIFYKRTDLDFKNYKKIFGAILFLWCAIFISALTSSDVAYGVKKFFERYVLHMSIIFPVALIPFERKKILRLAEIFFAGIFLSNLSVIIQALPRLSEPVWRFGGISSPMIQGSILAMFVPIYILFFLHLKNRKKFFALISVLIGIFALLLTGTRGAWLATAIVVPIVILIYAEKKLKYFCAILISLSIVGGIFLLTPALSNRAATITDLNMQANSERLLMWQSAWKMFTDHPIFGIGYGQYTNAYQNKYISPQAKERDLNHAHNNFIHILAEDGAVGFFAFIMLIFCLTKFCLLGFVREKNLAYLIFFSAFWGLLLHGFTEFNFETSMTGKILWLTFGLCLAFCRSR